MPMAVLLALGLFAGALTTWIGLGGGLFMTLILSMLEGPERALAAAAPALWMGNLHRVLLFRRSLDRPALLWVGAPAVVGAVAGGIVATALPARVLQILLATATLGALVPKGTRRAGRAWSTPLGGLAGFATATSGAGGPFVTPALLAMGVEGSRFVATSALIAFGMHTGRIGAYAAGGWIDETTLRMAAVLGVAIMVGNLIGRRLRAATSERVLSAGLRVMTAVLAIIAILSLA